MSQLIHSCSCREYRERLKEQRSGRGILCKNIRPSQDLGLDELLATKLAIDALNDYKPKPLPPPGCPQHGNDLKYWLFLVFDILDASLFRGILKGEVYMIWSDLPGDVHGITSKPGVRDARVRIDLNQRLAWTYPGIALAALIHHMAHAYFLVCCGFPESHTDRDKHTLGHGLGYSTLICKIMEVFKQTGGQNIMDLSKVLPSRRHSQRNNQLALAPGRQRMERTPGARLCSIRDTEQLPEETCRDHLLTISKMKASELMGNKKLNLYPKNRYYHTIDSKKSVLAPTPRAHYDFDPNDEIEMEYSSYVVPFPRKKLKSFPSLTIPESTLQVPAKSDQIFIAFHTYLMKGDYLPELGPSPYQNAAGPPIIAHFRSEATACLLTDVRVFALAGKMSFMELRRRALERMYSMAMIQEDPMAPLEEIYKENDLNGEDRYLLREWCRDFLRKLNPEIGINLVILEQSGQCRDRFHALVVKSDAFREDYRRAMNCYVIEKAIRLVGLAASSEQNGEANDRVAEMGNKLRTELLDARRLHALAHPAHSETSDVWTCLPGPTIESLPAGTAADYEVSRTDLQHLQKHCPAIAMCYEKMLEEQKEVESKAKQKSKANKKKGKEKGKAKTKEKDSDDGDSSPGSDKAQKQCAHRCELCRPGDRICTHPLERCLYCGDKRFSRRRRGGVRFLHHPSLPFSTHDMSEPHFPFQYAPV